MIEFTNYLNSDIRTLSKAVNLSGGISALCSYGEGHVHNVFILKDETILIDDIVPIICGDNACFPPGCCQIIRDLISSSEKFISLRPGVNSLVVLDCGLDCVGKYIAYTLDEFKANLIWEENEYDGVSIDLRLGRIWSPAEIVDKCPKPVAYRIWKGATQ